MEWMILPLKRYAEFSGRSRRMEYWMWVLFVIIVSVVLRFVERAIGLAPIVPAAPTGSSLSVTIGGTGPISGLFGLAILVPGLAVSVRRLHDTNRSGWWVGAFFLLYAGLIAAMVSLIFSAVRGGVTADTVSGAFAGSAAIIGLLSIGLLIYGIVLLVFFCLEGTRGPNRYGPDPLGHNPNLYQTFR